MDIKKNISRKEFITKSSKCVGNIVCTPLILSLINSCSKPNPVDPSENLDENSDINFLAKCPCHNAQFDQNGNVLFGPTTIPLSLYNTTNISDESFLIEHDNISYEILFSDHPTLLEINGISYSDGGDILDDNLNELDSSGLLFYRKSDNELLALSRRCTHQGCPVDPFEPV